MTREEHLAAGREAHAQQRWRAACVSLGAADQQSPLDPADLDRLATAAYLAGERSWIANWTREHQALVDLGERVGAARCAFWLGFGFINEGEMAQAGGWFARAQRLIDEAGADCVERGWLLVPDAIMCVDADPTTSIAMFTNAREIGERFADRDLVAVARHGESRGLIRLGEGARAMAVLDEVLVAVTSGELSPIITGDTYCGAVEACVETLDVRRAREWTLALTQWVDVQPELAAYRGQCLVYRAMVMQTYGDWPDAMRIAQEACDRLTSLAPHPAAGAAFYQRGEIQRLRGDVAAAEESYRIASEHGRDPQPGIALLRLAQGETATAVASARRLLRESAGRLARALALPALIEVLLAGDDLPAACTAAEELAGIADTFGSRFVSAQAAYASGAVALAQANPEAALPALRQAQSAWRELGATYDAARARVLIGAACSALGDEDSAHIEWEGARSTFEHLGAAHDLGRLAAMGPGGRPAPGGLTPRELDILRLVATGKTNRAIGDELVISEKTVARHISNIFNKLGVSSRSAATAFAYDHGLVRRPA